MGFIDPYSSECGDKRCRACYDENGVYKMVRKATKREQEAVEKSATTIIETEDRVPHVTEYEDLVDVLPDLAAEYRGIVESIKELEARKKEIGADIEALLSAVDARAFRGDNWVATRVEGAERETIKPELLLAEGVTMTQIEKATVVTQSAGYVQVRELKRGE